MSLKMWKKRSCSCSSMLSVLMNQDHWLRHKMINTGGKPWRMRWLQLKKTKCGHFVSFHKGAEQSVSSGFSKLSVMKQGQ
jgi:hypothetical protein